jgi:tetrahydromethanopterin S-methyltransferase subunit H
MFQKGDLILEDRKGGKFNRKAAEERIHELENISRETGVPCLVAMVANSEEEVKGYIDFFTSVTEMPFAIDIWQQKTRLAAAVTLQSVAFRDELFTTASHHGMRILTPKYSYSD